MTPRTSTSWSAFPRQLARRWQSSPWGTASAHWLTTPLAGTLVLVGGTLVASVIDLLVDRVVALNNPGLVYLPLIALLAYEWGWPLAASAVVLQLACVYLFFLAPRDRVKLLSAPQSTQLVTLLAVSTFVLALVQLARARRAAAERAAQRFAMLSRVGTALSGELDETRLLQQIAATARDLTGAQFAAFTLRPLNEWGEPAVPAEGHLFHLAAVVGVSAEQEALFRRMPLGGEGLLAPIFRYGVPVRVADALAHMAHPEPLPGAQARARSCAVFWASRCWIARERYAAASCWGIASPHALAPKTSPSWSAWRRWRRWPSKMRASTAKRAGKRRNWMPSLKVLPTG
jgi:hypothetical protein